MTEPRKPRIPAPPGLGLGGARLWKRVSKSYELRIDELILLENAARTVDIVARLDAAMIGQPLVVKGSMGQEREHPLLSEARQQRAALARLLAQIKLPDEDALPAVVQRSVKARHAASTRWARRS